MLYASNDCPSQINYIDVAKFSAQGTKCCPLEGLPNMFQCKSLGALHLKKVKYLPHFKLQRLIHTHIYVSLILILIIPSPFFYSPALPPILLEPPDLTMR